MFFISGPQGKTLTATPGSRCRSPACPLIAAALKDGSGSSSRGRHGVNFANNLSYQ